MSLVAIAILCVFLIQLVCYWTTSKIVPKLVLSLQQGEVSSIVANVFYIGVMFFLSVSSIGMLLAMRYVHLIFITCSIAIIILVTVANFVSEGGE